MRIVQVYRDSDYTQLVTPFASIIVVASALSVACARVHPSCSSEAHTMLSYQIWLGRAVTFVARPNIQAAISRLGCAVPAIRNLRFATALITYGQEGNQPAYSPAGAAHRFARRMREIVRMYSCTY